MPVRRMPRLIAMIALLLAATPTLVAVASDGSLTPHPTTPSFGSTGALNVALGDLDSDGDADAIVVGGQESVWLNGGDGTFTAHPTAPTFGSASDATYDVALGDLDGDSDLDAVTANIDSQNAVWLNDGTGAFSPHPTIPGFGPDGGIHIALGDLDGDGDLDAVVARGSVPETVWVNDGTGGFTPQPTAATFGDPGETGIGIALGDLDGDGDLDAVVAQFASPSTIWLNDGSGVFSAHPTVPGIGFSATADVALGDLDGDGDLDIVLANGQSLGSTVWLNDGTGAMSAQSTVPSFGPAETQSLALADLDGDSDLDAILANYDGPSSVWLNDGGGAFAPQPFVPGIGTDHARAVAIADLDGDSDADAILATDVTQTITVWINGASTVVADVVGDGTPESCTEAALDAALAGGGLITFDCGGTEAEPATIVVTNAKLVTVPTHIDGGNSIALSGGESTGILVVPATSALQVSNLTLRDGRATLGGAIVNDAGTLTINNVRFLDNVATDSGGAVASGEGTLHITDSNFEGNLAQNLGGAVVIVDGFGATLTGNTFRHNQAGRHAGAIMASGRNITIAESDFIENLSLQAGGAIYVTGEADVSVAGSQFTGNEADHILENAENLGGGAIRNDGSARITNSSFNGNRSQYGGAVMSANDLTMTDSALTENGALVDGGALYVIMGQANLERTNLFGNAAQRFGGGIVNVALTSLTDSTVESNYGAERGGGVYAFAYFAGAASTNIERSNIVSNVSLNGGGLFSVTSTLVRDSLFADNVAEMGGAIALNESDDPAYPAWLQLENSTISGNQATVRGGGIFTNVAYASILHSTIVNNKIAADSAEAPQLHTLAKPNPDSPVQATPDDEPPLTISKRVDLAFASSADQSFATTETEPLTMVLDVPSESIALAPAARSGHEQPAILADVDTSGGAGIFNNGVIDLMGSIIANSEGGADCLAYDGEVSSHGHNLDSDGTCLLDPAIDIIAADPLLGELDTNGGPTMTHALLAGSPAIDAGAPDCTYADRFAQPHVVTTDQRGAARPQGVTCDIGAYEAAQATGPEGAEIEIVGITDPQLGMSPIYAWSLDAGAPCVLSVVDTQNTSLRCDDDGVFTVYQRALPGDRRGVRLDHQVIVTVTNVAPSLDITSLPTQETSRVGEALSLTVGWTDPGTSDVVACTVDWGDSSQTSTAGTTGGAGSCVMDHTYSADGTYTILITAADDDGGTTSATTQAIVTRQAPALALGSGTINSPAGAYPDNPRFKGNAGFVFTVGNSGSAAGPSGLVVLTLSAARDVLVATDIDTMRTKASAVQFHGTGRLNGAPGYSFTVTALDGRPDRIRITIWNASGAVIYDNRPGQPLDLEHADPQPLRSGTVILIS